MYTSSPSVSSIIELFPYPLRSHRLDYRCSSLQLSQLGCAVFQLASCILAELLSFSRLCSVSQLVCSDTPIHTHTHTHTPIVSSIVHFSSSSVNYLSLLPSVAIKVPYSPIT